MKKFLLSTLSLAVVAMIFAPFSASAHEESSSLPKFVHPESEAVDHHGDANGIGKFKSNEANKHLFHVVGKVKSLSATELVVTAKVKTDACEDDNDATPCVIESKDYTFAVDTATKFIRKFKGTSSALEVSVGDRVKVWSTMETAGTAKLVWDQSIWWAAVKGKVTAIDATAKTVTMTFTWKIGNGKHSIRKAFQMTVKTDTATKYWQGTTEKAFSDLAVDQHLSVRGAWNSLTKTLLARKITILP